ncbi:hypothetical protein C0Q70_11444 [Pomacea canaliculata]|uniref:Fork-head domain-containing protein n=1 Tax=Pomacea canaliculata TaxID=400727 RepID=A0A2T7P602_POMCA|nr:hypothetical protein C0Q70_11444 [Pomacea canaliculata]
MDASDVDHNFEPQTRARSNTWPLRPSRELDPQSSPASEDSNADGQIKAEKDPLGLTAKKSGSRRNAWGNLSYADLITKAIQSSSEKRLTLSQIYDWMVQNVPYFKDKGDSTSSAGWKFGFVLKSPLENSKFDAKPGKAPRRRAGSMETKSYEKRRGRLTKKKNEALQNGGSPLTGSSEDFIDTLAFGDFRQRSSSNASSCGHLSPIHAGVESDLHDNQVPPMSTIPWDDEVEDSQGMYSGSDNYSELVGSLVVGMKLTTQDNIDMENGISEDPYTNGPSQEFAQSANYMSMSEQMSDAGPYTHLPAPPPYPDCNPNSHQLTNMECAAFPNESYTNLNCGMNGFRQSDLQRISSATQLSVNTQQGQLTSPDQSQQGSPNPQTFTPQRLSPQMQRTTSQSSMSPLNCQLSPQQTRAVASPVQRSSPSLQQQAAMQQAVTNASILREALTRGSYGQPPTTTTPFPLGTAVTSSINANILNMGPSSHHHMQQHSPQHQQLRISPSTTNSYILGTGSGTGCGLVANGPSTNCCNNNSIVGGSHVPLDIDMESLIAVDYDMDQVIKQELSLEGSLDFDFASAAGQSIVH